MGKEQIVLGAIISAIGILLSAKILTSNSSLFLLIYTLAITAVGITIIALNKEEETIEERKDIKTKRH